MSTTTKSNAAKPAPDADGYRTRYESGYIVPRDAAPPALLMNPDATPLSFAVALHVRLDQVASIVEQGCVYGDRDLGAYAGIMTQPIEEMELLIDRLETLLRGGRRLGAA